ncbi:glycosyl hydrolase family 95 catalytic domain-containing protein (plasmid) [Coraliomargarita sp. W4R53]
MSQKTVLEGKRRALAIGLAVATAVSGIALTGATQPAIAQTVAPANLISDGDSKDLRLWYDEAAPDSDAGWIDRSIPMGNGYMGVNLFGGTETDRIQITENSLHDSDEGGGLRHGGLSNFAEVYLDFDHDAAGNYMRELDLDEGVARVEYEQDGVEFKREYFTSYPDKVMAIHLTASAAEQLTFTLRPTIPFIEDGKSGTVVADGDTITLSGDMSHFGLEFEGQFKVIPDGGTIQAQNDGEGDNGTITVSDASSAVILIAVGTNYELDSQVFLTDEPADKLAGFPHPHAKVTGYIDDAAAKSYAELLATHQEDYTELYGRMDLDLGGVEPSMPTDDLIDSYRDGDASLYLEELAFQYGRYLLICSSRAGTLPPNLQGIWNVYQNPPWAAEYLHDTNLQMAYSPAFPTNMPELFESYADYFDAYVPRQEEYATQYIGQYNPSQLDPDGNNGWSGPFWTTPYEVPGKSVVAGFGTGSWIGMLFWDYFDYTQDEAILEDVVYPVISEQANFVSRFVQETDGVLLANPSSSPEQTPRNTVGTTFDQQMFYENHHNTLKAAEVLGVSNQLVDTLDEQLPLLDPIQVGKSGQIKEFRQEEYYGELGDPEHRHASQLLGLYPGQLINDSTPAWLDAAKVSLDSRGMNTPVGWARAERVSMWARAHDGEEAYAYYKQLLGINLMHNLFNDHRGDPLFQADGNYGATAGVSEMLMQSQDYVVAPLPAMPEAWSEGSYRGMLARGNFEVSASWSAGHADQLEVLSNAGGTLTLRYDDVANAAVKTASGQAVEFTPDGTDEIIIETTEGETYVVTEIPAVDTVAAPADLQIVDDSRGAVELAWTASADAESYNLYRAVGNAPDYELVASDIGDTSVSYVAADLDEIEQATLRVTAVSATNRESDGATTIRLLPAEEPVERPIYTGVATQSSTRFGGVPERAIDGNTDELNSHSHTDFQDQPWWELDLEQVKEIDEITLWNRTQAAPAERTKEFYVLVSDEPFVSGTLSEVLEQPGVSAYYQAEVPRPDSTFEIDRTGRYVRVQLTGINTGTSVALHLAEVQVFGPAASEQQETTTELSVSPSPALEGDEVMVTARVTSENESALPTGIVTFTVDGSEMGTAEIAEVSGEAIATFDASSFTPGSYVIGASYSGDDTFVSSQASDVSHTVEAASEPDSERPVVVLVSPSSVGPFQELSVQVDAADNAGLNRVVANIYKDGVLVKSTQSAADGAMEFSHQATVSLPDGSYSMKYNASDLAGNISTTSVVSFTIDATAPTVTVKSGSEFTVGDASAGYEKLSVKLFDAGLVDRVEINGTVKDLNDAKWSDVNGVTPGTFGAVLGENTLVVFDVAGNTTELTFTLVEPTPAAPAWDAAVTYNTGDEVTFDGATYVAQWWTRNSEPGTSVTGSWMQQGDLVPAAGTDVRAWTASWVYTGGEVVAHNGHVWKAKWWTRNATPGSGPWQDLGSY